MLVGMTRYDPLNLIPKTQELLMILCSSLLSMSELYVH